jgi:quercetin dioxygenase-like cupin family protein
MFYKNSNDNFEKMIEGISIKTLLYGEKTLFSEFHMDKGSKIPVHSHPQEQTGRLLKGKIMLTINDETAEMNPGDCWVVPGNVAHSVHVAEDSIAIEVFSPVREDYLKYYKK